MLVRALPSTNVTAFMLQILGITSRAAGADARSVHSQPQSETSIMTPRAPVHARMQQADHSLAGLPSFQEMAAGLAGRQSALGLKKQQRLCNMHVCWLN